MEPVSSLAGRQGRVRRRTARSPLRPDPALGDPRALRRAPHLHRGADVDLDGRFFRDHLVVLPGQRRFLLHRHRPRQRPGQEAEALLGAADARADHHRHHGAGHQRHPDFHRRHAAVDSLQALLRRHPGEPVGGFPAAVPAGVDHPQPRQRRHALLLRGLPARHAGAVRRLAGTAGVVAEHHLRRLLPLLLRRRRHAPAVGRQRAPGVSRDRGAAPARRGPARPQPAPDPQLARLLDRLRRAAGDHPLQRRQLLAPRLSAARRPPRHLLLRCLREPRTSSCACTSRSSASST